MMQHAIQHLLELIWGGAQMPRWESPMLGTNRRREREKREADARVALYQDEPKSGPPSRQLIRKMARARAHEVAAPSYSWRRHFANEWFILRNKLRPA